MPCEKGYQSYISPVSQLQGRHCHQAGYLHSFTKLVMILESRSAMIAVRKSKTNMPIQASRATGSHGNLSQLPDIRNFHHHGVALPLAIDPDPMQRVGVKEKTATSGAEQTLNTEE